MTQRRRSQPRRRRPVVLIGALVAPAILAGGLLAGEMGVIEGRAAVVYVRGEMREWVLFEPVWVPAPARPQRRYEGFLPGVVPRKPKGVVAKPKPLSEPQVLSRSQPRSVVRPRLPEVVEPVAPTPAPVASRAECPGEWEDTWLWEVCREDDDKDSRSGWVGGL